MRHRGQAYERVGRQLCIWMLVLAAHVLVVIVFWNRGPLESQPQPLPTEPPIAVVDLQTAQPQREQSPKGPQRLQRRATAGPPAARTDRTPITPMAGQSQPAGEADGSPAIHPDEAPRTDWYRDLDATVQALTPEMIKEYTRLCTQAERPHLKHAAGCPRSPYEGYWRPSGDLLRDIRDPDRPRSSVPDALPPAFPTAPQSVVRIRPEP